MHLLCKPNTSNREAKYGSFRAIILIEILGIKAVTLRLFKIQIGKLPKLELDGVITKSLKLKVGPCTTTMMNLVLKLQKICKFNPS